MKIGYHLQIANIYPSIEIVNVDLLRTQFYAND